MAEDTENIDIDDGNEEPPEEKKPKPKINISKDKVVAVGDDIEILYDKRLPDYDQGEIQAFAARTPGEADNGFFVLVCENHLVPRRIAIPTYRSLKSEILVPLKREDVTYWPPAKEERCIFIYENTLGEPLMRSLDQIHVGLSEDRVINSVIKPIISTFIDFQNAGFFHGAIRPNNMFNGGVKKFEKVKLGDCLATPPGYTNPSIFETIERAMAEPIARGHGTVEDDLYALGVTVCFLLREKDPFLGLDDRGILQKKIELGSYGALVGESQFSGAVLELLRGLLYDDMENRWTLDELTAWLDGTRLSPKQTARKVKAARSINFNDEQYFYPAFLAMDLEKNPELAMNLINAGAIDNWSERSFGNNFVKDRLEEARVMLPDPGPGAAQTERVLCRLSVALDGEAPFRYRGRHMHPDGIAYALAKACVLDEDVLPFAELFVFRVIVFLIGMYRSMSIDTSQAKAKFENCSGYVRQKNQGYGIERCLYYLALDAPCISPKFKGYYVRSPEDLLRAWEKIVAKPDRPDLVLDRHVVSFLWVRDRRVIEHFMIEINAHEHYIRVLANLKVLATIQQTGKLGKFPNVAKWAGEVMDAVYEMIHDRDLRASFKKRIDDLVVAGDLVKISMAADKGYSYRRDISNFREAMKEYSALRGEYRLIEDNLKRPDQFGKQTGKEIAAIVSGAFAALIIIGLAFVHFAHGFLG